MLEVDNIPSENSENSEEKERKKEREDLRRDSKDQCH